MALWSVKQASNIIRMLHLSLHDMHLLSRLTAVCFCNTDGVSCTYSIISFTSSLIKGKQSCSGAPCLPVSCDVHHPEYVLCRRLQGRDPGSCLGE